MEPILNRINELQTQLSGLAAPAHAESAAADAVRAWDDAMAQNDFPTMRAMIRRAFPNLTIAPQARRNHHSADRILWNPSST